MSATTKTRTASKHEATKDRPAHEVRSGRLKATIWRQESEKGPWFNVVLSRSYRDEGGNWHTAASFGSRDLLELAKLCDQAHTWIAQHSAKSRKGSGPDEDEQEEIPY
jgi:hypothetical protein